MYDRTPNFHEQPDEALLQRDQLLADGYEPVAGVLPGPNQTIAQGINLHERGDKLMKAGAHIGPYVVEGEVLPGFSFYMSEAR